MVRCGRSSSSPAAKSAPEYVAHLSLEANIHCPDLDEDLEGAVREEAERQLRNAALDDGILKTATANARQTITNILKSLGFAKVEVN